MPNDAMLRIRLDFFYAGIMTCMICGVNDNGHQLHIEGTYSHTRLDLNICHRCMPSFTVAMADVLSGKYREVCVDTKEAPNA